VKLTTWRIVRPEFVDTAFDGEGAKLYGGRWNREGVAMIYTAATASLAVLEMLVHLKANLDYYLRSATFDDSLLEVLDPKILPPEWQTSPAPQTLAEIGSDWVKSRRSLALAVPSVILPMEFNYLLNPAHPSFRKVVIGEPILHRLDTRLKT
jgi:RES domain-containing protein